MSDVKEVILLELSKKIEGHTLMLVHSTLDKVEGERAVVYVDSKPSPISIGLDGLQQTYDELGIGPILFFIESLSSSLSEWIKSGGEELITAHDNESFATQFFPLTWKDRDGSKFKHCSYCGSLTPRDALILFKTPGVKYSGSDWKYGYPHKFYLEDRHGHYKFYTCHLKDMSSEFLDSWNEVVAPLTDIEFYHWRDLAEGERPVGLDASALVYHAVPGVQRYGTVGEGPDDSSSPPSGG